MGVVLPFERPSVRRSRLAHPSSQDARWRTAHGKVGHLLFDSGQVTYCGIPVIGPPLRPARGLPDCQRCG